MDSIHNYLREKTKEIRSHKIPLHKFIIIKALTKQPEDYADAKGQPHVQVALKMKQSVLIR